MLQMASLRLSSGQVFIREMILGEKFYLQDFVWTRLVGASLLPGGGGVINKDL